MIMRLNHAKGKYQFRSICFLALLKLKDRFQFGRHQQILCSTRSAFGGDEFWVSMSKQFHDMRVLTCVDRRGHFAVFAGREPKIAFGIIACTPLFPSTSCVISRSAATLDNM